jgi:hypothetical protein
MITYHVQTTSDLNAELSPFWLISPVSSPPLHDFLWVFHIKHVMSSPGVKECPNGHSGYTIRKAVRMPEQTMKAETHLRCAHSDAHLSRPDGG